MLPPWRIDRPTLGKASIKLLLAFTVIGVLAGVLIVRVQRVREAAERLTDQGNLVQLGVGLLNYEWSEKHYFPAYLVDADGRPMHSWRVLVLPYIEGHDVYKQYNFSEPWDSETN